MYDICQFILLLIVIAGCFDLFCAEESHDGLRPSSCDVPSSSRLHCGGRGGTQKNECIKRKCCWLPAKSDSGSASSCYYSKDYLQSTDKRDNVTILSWFDQFPWSQYANTILQQAYTIDRGLDYPRVYYSIFAGRSKFLDIHLKYCDMLLRLKYVTEVHIWDFTGNGWDFVFDNFQNKNYVSRFITGTDMDGYRLFQKSSSRNNRFRRRRKNGDFEDFDYKWGSYYEHYANNKRYRDTDILVKADDDIVFMDLSNFAKFITDISTYQGTHLHFPNIINNDAGFIVQADHLQRNSAVHKWIRFYTSVLHLNLTDRITRGYDDIYNNLNTEPLTTWKHGVRTQANFLFDIHQLFLKDPKSFLDAMHEPSSDQSRFIQIYRRISLNMYAGNFVSVRKYFAMFLHLFCCEDESFVGAIPSITGDSHIMHTHFVVSHHAFYLQTQPENADVLASIRDVYEHIATVFETIQLKHMNITA